MEVEEPKLDEENLPEIEDMVSVCAGLVTVDEESDIIRLIHYSAQEYFERTQFSWFPNAQRDIAVTCITYLSFSAFDTGFCPTDESFKARLQQNVLYDYAARNWGHHARTASIELEDLILDFLKDEAKVSASSQAMMDSRDGVTYTRKWPTYMTGVHLAAYFGLNEVTNTLLRNGVPLNSKDSDGRTPLWYAAKNGHVAVVQLLLAKDSIDLDSKDTRGLTPLSWAAWNGHEAMVKLLLAEDGVDPQPKEILVGRTPLSWAAWNGHEKVVKLLLAKDGVDPDSKDFGGRTPLSWAVEKGYVAVVKLLLANDGVDPNSKDNDGRTPLSWAAERGHEAVMKLLREKGAKKPQS